MSDETGERDSIVHGDLKECTTTEPILPFKRRVPVSFRFLFSRTEFSYISTFFGG